MDFKRGIAVIVTLMLLLGTVKIFGTYEGISNIITTVSLNFNIDIPEPYRVEYNESNDAFFGEKYNFSKLNYDYEGVKKLESFIEWESSTIKEDEIEKILRESSIEDKIINAVKENLPAQENIDKHFLVSKQKKALVMLYSELDDMLYVYEIH